MLVTRAREMIETDEPDAERDREADKNDDERSQRNEWPAPTG